MITQYQCYEAHVITTSKTNIFNLKYINCRKKPYMTKYVGSEEIIARFSVFIIMLIYGKECAFKNEAGTTFL